MSDRAAALGAGASAARGVIRGKSIFALLLASAQAPLGSTMIAVALPSISHDLRRELSLCTSLLVTSYLIVNIIGQSPGGKIGDVLGHPQAVRVGIALQATGALGGLFASGLWALVIARCTLALGGALVLPATMALLRVHVPPERRGRVFGMVGATMGLSAAIGPPLGGELVSRFGWRSMFFAPLPLLGIAVVLLRAAPLPPSATKKRFGDFARNFDFAGTALLALGLGALVAGSKADGALRAAALAASLLTVAVFVVWELRAKSPVLDPRLFSHRAFSAGSAIVAVQNFAMYGLLFQLPQYFQQLRGSTPKEVGRVLFLMMLAMFAASPAGGRLTDKFGSRRTALIGAVIVLAGMVWMQRLGSFLSPPDAAPGLIVLGLGLGLSGAPSQAAAMAAVSAEQSGMAAGATSTLRYLGGVASILVESAILGHSASIAAHQAAVRVSVVAALAAVPLCMGLPGASPNRAKR